MSYSTDYTLKPHKFANLLRPLTEPELSNLERDIKEHGVKNPVWLYQGKILDGRNRFKIAKKLKLKFPTRTLGEKQGDEAAIRFVIREQIGRRNLSEAQRAAFVAEVSQLKLGLGETKTGQKPPESLEGVSAETSAPSSLDDRAKLADVSRATQSRVEVAIQDPELKQGILNGELSANEAYREHRKRTAPKPAHEEEGFISRKAASQTDKLRDTIAQLTDERNRLREANRKQEQELDHLNDRLTLLEAETGSQDQLRLIQKWQNKAGENLATKNRIMNELNHWKRAAKALAKKHGEKI